MSQFLVSYYGDNSVKKIEFLVNNVGNKVPQIYNSIALVGTKTITYMKLPIIHVADLSLVILISCSRNYSNALTCQKPFINFRAKPYWKLGLEHIQFFAERTSQYQI